MWAHRFTPAGRVLTLVLIGTGSVAGGLGIHFPLYYFGLALLALLVVSMICGFVFGPTVTVTRRLPERCAAGARVLVTARVENTGRLPLYDFGLRETATPPGLRLEDRPVCHPRLGRGEAADVVYPVEPRRRGVYDLPGPQVFTAFPFGIYNYSRRKLPPDPHRLIVYPSFVPLAEVDLPAGRKHQPGGLQLVSSVGDSEEFVGLREYRPGDRLRDVHQRAWARVGHPVVREFQQEYLTRIALVVDTFGPRPRRAARRAMEAAISLAAGVADVLSRQEYVVDVFAAGPELYHFQAGRSLAYLDNILDVLACIEPCRESPFARLTPALLEEIAQISTAVIVLLDWDEERLTFVREVQGQGVAVKVAVVRDGPPSADPAGFTSEAGPVLLFTPAEVEAGVERL